MNKKYKIIALFMCVCFALTHGTLTVHAESTYPWQILTDMEIERNPYGDNCQIVDSYFIKGSYGSKSTARSHILYINNVNNCRCAVYSDDWDNFYFFSAEPVQYSFYNDYYYYDSGAFIKTYESLSGTTKSRDGLYAVYIYDCQDGYNGPAHTFNYSDVPVFNTKEGALGYINSGVVDSNSCVYNPIMFEYSDEICLEDFYMEVHSSNTAELSFIRLYYKPSQFMIDNDGEIKMYLTWDMQVEALSGIGLGVDLGVFDDHFRDIEFVLPLSPSNNNYIDLYVVDDILEPNLGAFDSDILNWLDLNLTKLVCTGGDNGIFDGVFRVDKSAFDMTIKCSAQGVQGVYYSAYADLLNPNNSYTSFSKPVMDDNGNYTEDYQTVSDSYNKTEGYYYTNVSQDNYGNNTYNYYYIDSHNISTEISSDGSGSPVVSDKQNIDLKGNVNVNVNLNQDDNNDKIVINDDDYSGNTLIDNVTNLYGLRDDLQTAEKDDGALTFLERLLGVLPGDFAGMLGYGCSTVVLVAILRAFLKR